MTDVSSDTVLATGSSTARTLANIASDTVHPTAFGVVGNGTTNDTTAFQNWINYCAANSYAAVVPPNLNCYVGTVLIPAKTNLVIDGTLTLVAATNGPVLQVRGGPFSITGSGTINGNKSAQTAAGAGCAGINSNPSYPVTGGFIANLIITNCYNWPINMVAMSNLMCLNLTLTNSGNSPEFAASSNNCWFYGGVISGINDDSFAFYQGATNCGILGTEISGGTGYGVVVLDDGVSPGVGSNHITIRDLNITGCAAGAVGVYTNSPATAPHSDIVIDNVSSRGNCTNLNTPFDFYISNCSHVSISNIKSTGCGAAGGHVCYAVLLDSSASDINIINSNIWDVGIGAGNGVGFQFSSPSYVTIIGGNVRGISENMAYAFNGTLGIQNQIQGVNVSGFAGSPFNATTRTDSTVNITAGSYAVITTSGSTYAAAGTTQGTAVAIDSQTAIFVAVTAGSGGILVENYIGIKIEVSNLGANALLIYPPTGGKINFLAVNGGYSIAVGGSVRFTQLTASQWYTS
jgi:hypothetical protein